MRSSFQNVIKFLENLMKPQNRTTNTSIQWWILPPKRTPFAGKGHFSGQSINMNTWNENPTQTQTMWLVAAGMPLWVSINDVCISWTRATNYMLREYTLVSSHALGYQRPCHSRNIAPYKHENEMDFTNPMELHFLIYRARRSIMGPSCLRALKKLSV